MVGLLRGLQLRAEAFLPGWMVEAGPEMVRRGRTAVLLAWLMATMFGAVLVMRVVAAEWRAALIDVGLVVACGGGPYLLRWTGRYYLVANTALGAVFALLCYLGFTNANPGLNAATVALAEIPLFAIILFGPRIGYAWSAACASAVVVIGVSDFEVLVAPTLAERAAFNEYWAALVMCGTLVSAGLFYERGKDASLKRIAELDESRRKAELEAVHAQADMRVREAERFASMGRLAAAVAHEINNPLSFVQNNLEFLERDAPSGQRDALVESLKGVERIRRIVTDLQTMTRPPDEEEPSADVARAASTASSMARGQTRSKAVVQLEIEENLWAACDEGRLIQLLLNLLVNAAQALPEGHKEDHRISVRGSAIEGRAVIEVEDDGPGIPEEHLARVREPFFTTKPIGEGMGLGLALCEGIARSYGGVLEVESVPGRTVVRARLDLAIREPRPIITPTPTPPVEAPEEQPSLRILVCDDEVFLARAIQRHLKALDVDVVHDGSDAIARLAEDPDYDLVICDMMMPNVTGMDVYETVEKTNPDLAERIVFMTGGTFTPRSAEFRDREGIRFLDKPIKLEELWKIVHETQKKL